MPLNITYKEDATNEEVCNKIQDAFGKHDDLHSIVNKRKLRWSRPSGMAKTILQGTVKGRRRKGRQREGWDDTIKDWTRIESGESVRTIEDRVGWRRIGGAATTIKVKGLR